MLTFLFSFQFKDVLYENGEQAGADDSPGESIVSYFQTPSAVWVRASSVVRAAKPGEVMAARGHPLRAGLTGGFA